MLKTWLARWPWLSRCWDSSLALAALAAVTSVVGVALAVQHLAEHHLAAEAKRASALWGQHLASSVPDLDLIFMGQAASAQAQQHLTGMRGMAGLLHFNLYDPQGRRVLDSDSPGTRATAADPQRQQQARHAAQHGASAAQLSRGQGASAPAMVSTSFVPLRHGTQTIGVAEIVLDQSASAVTTAQSFRRAALLAGLAMALCIAVAATLVRQRARQEQRLHTRASFLAEHDVLTGALTHSHFSRRLEQACRHSNGRRNSNGDSQSVSALAQRMLARLAEPHDLPGLSEAVHISACVGAALHGVDGTDAGSLLHNAELALLRAKSNGRSGWSFYDASLDRRLQERRALAHDLSQALSQGWLRLHFQPLYGDAGHTLTGYEALARWPHPSRGFVPPAEFIPVAEDNGQIEALGRWVLDAACHEAASWPAPLSVAVNLSAAQFRRGDAIVGEVAAALAASGLAPQRLELEITESLLINHTQQVLATLQALRGLGVRIAMDDFGTGYSSLAYLWRFPFDKLKIDRALTQGLGSDARVDAVVRSIVTLAHSLSIKVNAEGVETAAQRDALCQHGCDELQGYLLGRPMPADRLVHRENEVVVVLETA